MSSHADHLRAIVRDMHRHGLITVGEKNDAMRAIVAGRGAAAVAWLRRQVAG